MAVMLCQPCVPALGCLLALQRLGRGLGGCSQVSTDMEDKMPEREVCH